MGQVMKMRGETVQGTASPMRQAGRVASHPASQFVRVGTIARNLLERLEREMNEKAITKP